MNKGKNLIAKFRKQKCSKRAEVIAAVVAMAKLAVWQLNLGNAIGHIQFAPALSKKNY